MNKLLTKIVGLSLGLSMAIGVGIAVATTKSNPAEPVEAADLTAEKTASELATLYSWEISSGSGTKPCYTNWALDSNISISTSGSANCGSYWSDGWRLYQAQSGDLTITASSGYVIKSATFTYTNSNSGSLYDGSTAKSSGSEITINATTKTLAIKSTASGKTNGQVRISNFKVVYAQQASKSIDIGGAATINSSNSLSIEATLSGVTGTPNWSANPSTGVTFTSGNPTTMTVANSVANATVIEVTATIGDTVSNTKKVVVSNNDGSSAHPFEADEAVQLIRNGLFNSSDTYYVSGYVKSSSYSSDYGNATIFISSSSDNTEIPDTDCVELFRAVGDAGIDISGLQQGFSIVASGTMTYYQGSQPEFAQGCIVRSVTTPSVTVDTVTVVSDSEIDAHGASSIDAEVEYDVTYIGTTGTKAVSVHIENSKGEETGFEFTTPLAGTFTVTFTANETYTITVTSNEDDTKSDDTEIVVSGIVAPVTAQFEKYSSDLISGDEYVFISASYVMSNSISSSKIANGTLPTITDDQFTTSDYSIVFIITKVGDYYTIQNKNTSKYVAGTTSKNSAALVDSVDDHARWTITHSGGAWVFENLGRASDTDTPANRYLRNNTTYGWGCYGSGTGGEVNLYHKVDTSRALTDLSITTASSKLTFNQGEALTVPNMAVTATFSSAPVTVEYSGMNSSDSKGLTFSPVLGSTLSSTGTVTVTVSLTYNGNTESDTFDVSVVAYTAPTYTKVTSSNAPIDLRGTYLVVYEDGTDAYIMNSALGSSSSTMDVTENYVSGTITGGDTITGSIAIDAAAVQIVRHDIEGASKYFMKSSADTYYAATASKLNVATEPSADIELSLSDLNEGLRPHLGSNVIKFNNTSNQMRFRIYASSSSMQEVSLYKLNATSGINAEVNNFVSGFYGSFKSTENGGLCDANGNSNITNINTAWGTHAEAFSHLSADAQGILACTTYTHEAETPGTQADAIDRYDYIYSKYSASLTDGDFMNRSGLSAYQATGVSGAKVTSFLFDNANDSTVVAIITIISVISVSAIGGFFFLRKRKEQ